MSSNKIWITIIALLLVVIVVMTWYLVATPGAHNDIAAPATAAVASSSAPSASSTEPLSAQVTVTSPASGASVERTFTINGIAPNGWYFEAVFPIQIRDGNDDLIASGQGQAQSDWTVPGPVPFTATITITRTYSGPATLILLRDNPSGLPQDEDEVTVPIVII